MTYADFQKLLLLADRMIASSAPRKAEYGRGYHLGIQIHFNNARPGSLPDHYSIAEIARQNGCRNVHAFARGYRDGCMGLKPEYPGNRLATFGRGAEKKGILFGTDGKAIPERQRRGLI
jgi:hypothetical protein